MYNAHHASVAKPDDHVYARPGSYGAMIEAASLRARASVRHAEATINYREHNADAGVRNARIANELEREALRLEGLNHF